MLVLVPLSDPHAAVSDVVAMVNPRAKVVLPKAARVHLVSEIFIRA